MKLFRASAEDIVGALLLPTPRSGGHDVLPAAGTEGEPSMLDVEPSPAVSPGELGLPSPRGRRHGAGPVAAVATALPDDVERQLAHLAGVDSLPVTERPEATLDVDATAAPVDFSRQLLRIAQVVAVGGLVLIAAAAALSARYGSGALRVAPFSFAAWGVGAGVCAVTLAALGSDPTTGAASSARRRAAGTALLVALVTCVSGVVASAGGVAGPVWVLFLPVVLVCGAVVGPVRGLAVGATAAAGLYVAALLSHTLTVAGVGRLVVVLPACPAAGWAAGALAGLARQAALEAARRRVALEQDVDRLASVLAGVAAGDLTRVPAPGDAADPVATSVAVVFADTLLALRRLVRQMGRVTDQLATSAGELSHTAEEHVNAVEAQTAAVAETTTTVEELAATAGAIAEIAERVSRFAGSTRRDVGNGADAVQSAGAAMEAIAGRVRNLAGRADALRGRIGEVGTATRLIDDLARRTTILAVNASIEAARAGDQGAGFGTVAEEVTRLAARAREATGQIADILAQLDQQAAATARASEEGLVAVDYGQQLQAYVVASLQRISAMVDRTTVAAREITEATRQQRVASDAVVSAMATVTASSERYRTGSHGHAAAARRMNELAEGSRESLARFKVG